MSETLELIIKIGATFGALTTIFAFFKVYKPFNKLRDWFNEPVQFNIKALQEDNKEIHKEVRNARDDILQIKICSPNLPIEERLLAGHEYVDVRNLNGKVKVEYHVLQEQYEEQLRSDK